MRRIHPGLVALALLLAVVVGGATRTSQLFFLATTCSTSQWVRVLANGVAATCSQPTSSDISGLGTAAVKNTGTSGNTVPLLDGTNTWTNAQTAASFIPSSSTVPSNGMYLPSSNIPALSSSGNLMLRWAWGGTVGRGGVFNYEFKATTNVLSMFGGSNSGTIGFLDFANLAGTQLGSINCDQAANCSLNNISDARLKKDRSVYSFDEAERVVNSLTVFDYDRPGNDLRGVGFVAQEIFKVLPKMVGHVGNDLDVPRDDPAFEAWTVDYLYPMPYVVANVQRLNRRVAELERTIKRLSALVSSAPRRTAMATHH